VTARNMSGLWMGSFAYPGGEGPRTVFMARIEDRGGRISGTTIEPNTVGRGSETLEALLRGSRSGASVDFVKTYDGASDAAHAVDYVGRLSEDGNRVEGVWSLESMDGTFEMFREAVWEEAAGETAEVTELVETQAERAL
jgi:hypothetical protein